MDLGEFTEAIEHLTDVARRMAERLDDEKAPVAVVTVSLVQHGRVMLLERLRLQPGGGWVNQGAGADGIQVKVECHRIT
jgi:hypothetical protein